MADWEAIGRAIAEATGRPFVPREQQYVGGGCINTTSLLGDGERSYFVKLNSADRTGMFEAEFDGLQALDQSRTLRVPKPLCHGIAGDRAYLVMERIELAGAGDDRTAGEQLAAMHRCLGDSFGWRRDNIIGATHQPNPPMQSWTEFWHDHRLGFQLELAKQRGHGGRLQERGRLLLELFPALATHNPVPSLLHGDLWGGNLAYDRSGRPVIFDPAVYYGDREADIAMTELFGGFSRRFYDSYNATWPLDSGYDSRRTLYNLYHILNHLNLFGGGYGGQALRMTDQLLAELGH